MQKERGQPVGHEGDRDPGDEDVGAETEVEDGKQPGRHAQHLVQPARGRQVPAERLLHDDAGVLGALRPPEALDDDGEQARRDREVVRRPVRAVERIA